MAQSFETEKTFAVFLTVKRHTRRPAEVRKAGRSCVFQNIRGRVMPQNSTAQEYDSAPRGWPKRQAA